MFENLISDELRDMASEAIVENLRAYSVSSRFYYPMIQYEDCNCSNTINSQSPNPYLHKTSSTCVICGGTGKKPIETYDDLDIAVVFDKKGFQNMGGNFVFNSEGSCYTMSVYNNTVTPINKCSYVIFDYGKNTKKFERVGTPQILSFGNATRFILQTWKEIG